ncbi:hypothetical protein HNR44_000535 [Geomicrobium halophilum]|uniref:Glycosyltransferase 2-like domain-containing protein n=1 Tax=Geomicrobium halophilum TaxID=549000 RepID=A0A841PN00_9BACL|nr:glycosyltransferase family 2 protein [Geomicrobium halophilum]MBB6448586.1 hypothetical protein [Geomicrobium halophilum]
MNDNVIGNTWSIVMSNNDLGETLNQTLHKIESNYVMFLQDQEYLSSNIEPSTLALSHPKFVMTDSRYFRNLVLHQPFFVKTTLLQKTKFFTKSQLPFQKALLPSWLSTINHKHVCSIDQEWVKQPQKNSSVRELEKLHFLKKYESYTIATASPTVSVILSNFNMESYVEAAIASCILQNTPVDQLLMIDDGSNDHSYHQMEKWQEHEQVTLFQKENQGKARALNDLLPHVESDFVMELDADDWLDPNALSTIKEKLRQLPKDVSVLYGNLRKWKQMSSGDVMFKGIAKGKAVKTENELLSYRFPLGPRIYRTCSLKQAGGFPVISFENGWLYEDVSVLMQLLKRSSFSYQDFTVYNVREHNASISKQNLSKWNDFLKYLKR